MAGNRIGGKKAAATNKRLYGKSFYAEIGAIGGKLGRTGGFYGRPELARAAGAKGGRISKRTKSTKKAPAMSDWTLSYVVDDVPTIDLGRPAKKWWRIW